MTNQDRTGSTPGTDHNAYELVAGQLASAQPMSTRSGIVRVGWPRISDARRARYCWRKGTAMAKTLIDVDDEQLAAAQKVLNTETKKDTVNAALRQVIALAARRRDLQRLIAGGLPDLADEEVMRAAWQ